MLGLYWDGVTHSFGMVLGPGWFPLGPGWLLAELGWFVELGSASG